MTTVNATLNQVLYLVFLILIGYLLTKCRIVETGAATVLSKLEKFVFMPALTFKTFMTQFTVDKLGAAGRLILVSSLVILAVLPVAFLFSRLLSKDSFTRNILLYGLSAANFGYVGIAVAEAIFPEYALDYMVFIIPLNVFIYAWSVPVLLIGTEGGGGIRERLRSFCNPMFIAMIVGIVFGLVGIPLPSFLTTSVNALGSCMSPLAMVLTGITVAAIPLKKVFATPVIYAISAVRLLLIPIAFLFLLKLFPLENNEYVCAICSLAMPLGLNSVIIPSAYGRDTTVATSMALVSHLLSVATIPLVFWLMQMQIG